MKIKVIKVILAGTLMGIQAAAEDIKLTVETGTPVQANFRGVGFNLNGGVNDDPLYETAFVKPFSAITRDGYSRLFCSINGWAPTPETRNWEAKEFKDLCKLLTLLKELNQDVYLTMVMWGDGPDWMHSDILNVDEGMRAKWAKAMADFLEELVVKRGFDNVTTWCMTNELQLKGKIKHYCEIKVEKVGTETRYIPQYMPLFKAHHQLVYDELKRRGLEKRIMLLASDGLGRIDTWRATLPWCRENMDDITGVYGAHEYPHDGGFSLSHPDTGAWFTSKRSENGSDWASPEFYDYALLRFRYGAKETTGKTGKGFVLGEYGGAGKSVVLPNGRLDTMRGSDMPIYGTFLCERTIAGMRAGFMALAKWHACDLQNVYPGGWTATLRHGTFKLPSEKYEVRPDYHAFGLMTRFCRKGSSVFNVQASDGLIRAIAVRHNRDNKSTIIMVNRRKAPAQVTIELNGLLKRNCSLMAYQYDVARVPEENVLWGPVRKVDVVEGLLRDVIPADGVVVLTDDYAPETHLVELPPLRNFKKEIPAVTTAHEQELKSFCINAELVAPFTLRMKGDTKLPESTGRQPPLWSANSWNLESVFEIALGTEPLTGQRALLLRNVEGKPALQFYTWKKCSLLGGVRYQVLVEYLLEKGSAVLNLNGVESKLPLEDTGTSFKLVKVDLAPEDDVELGPQFQSLAGSTVGTLWIKRFEITANK